MKDEKYQHIFEILREEIKTPGSVQWFERKQMKHDVETMLGLGLMDEVHECMVDFYEGYLMGQINQRSTAWDFIDFVAERDGELGVWATGKIDLMKLTERWIELGNSHTLPSILARLGQTGYVADWHHLRTTMDEKLCRMEVDGTRNGMKETGYFYCLLHAFTMIMMAEVDVEKKMKLLEQFPRRWNFLRYMYSVMTRTIIGFGFSNFASVTNNLTNDKEYEPFYHLYHSPLKERFDELCEKGTKRERLLKAFQKLEQRMKQATPSDELDELCEVLFPDEFRDMLNRNRPKSYRELEGEISRIKQEMNDTVEALNKQVRELASRLSAAVEASVPIHEIEEELMKFQSREALAIYMQLNALLVGNSAWQTQTLRIRDKILARQHQEMQLSINITALSGSNVNGVVQQQTNTGILPSRQITSV